MYNHNHISVYTILSFWVRKNDSCEDFRGELDSSLLKENIWIVVSLEH